MLEKVSTPPARVPLTVVLVATPPVEAMVASVVFDEGSGNFAGDRGVGNLNKNVENTGRSVRGGRS